MLPLTPCGADEPSELSTAQIADPQNTEQINHCYFIYRTTWDIWVVWQVLDATGAPGSGLQPELQTTMLQVRGWVEASRVDHALHLQQPSGSLACAQGWGGE